MYKKLAVATIFAASTLVAVPAANAGSEFTCMQEYEVALIACEGDEPCETWAGMTFTSCLQALATVEQ